MLWLVTKGAKPSALDATVANNLRVKSA